MDSLCPNILYITHFMDPLGQNIDTAIVTGDVIRARGTVDTEGRYVPLFLPQLQWYLSDISSNVSWQWYCEDFHLWSNQVRISDMLWTCSIFPWAAGGYGTKYSMLYDIIQWVYEQDITKWANGLHHQILDGNNNKVAVRYLGSEFLGHATAVDLLTHFKQGISRLDPKRLLQVSMDGPNVNWKFYTDLTKERNSEELPQLLNIGSCGLHIVHGGLQKGVNESAGSWAMSCDHCGNCFTTHQRAVKTHRVHSVPPEILSSQMGRGCCYGREGSPNVAQHQEVCFVFPCNTQEGPADNLICHNQRSMWRPTDGD